MANQMGDMDTNTCLLDIIDDPNALSEFFAQGPENGQVAVTGADDLEDLQATLWDDDPAFVSATTSDVAFEALAGTTNFSQPTALPQTIQSTAAASPKPQHVVTPATTQVSLGGATNFVPFQSTSSTALVQGATQVLTQPNSAMVSGSSAPPLMQLSTGNNAASGVQQQQQVFLQTAVSAGQIQLRPAQAQQATALSTVQVPTASSPAPSNVLNLGQMIRPIGSTGTPMQIRPQQIIHTSTAQGGPVNLQGTIIQTSTGNRILIQQPMIPGQQINLANLQGLQLRPQVQGTQIIQQGQVFQAAQPNQTIAQPAQLVQGTPTVQQGQVLQTSHGATQVVQQGQLLQQNQQTSQLLQTSQGAHVLQSTQQGQIVQPTVVNPATLQQPQQQPTQQTIQLAGQQPAQQTIQLAGQQPAQQTIQLAGQQPQQQTVQLAGQQPQQQTIQLAGNQLPTGVSVLNINGQQILIQKAPTPDGQIILRAIQNVIPIQTPAANTAGQVGGQVPGSQQQVLIAQPSAQIQPSQVQIPQNQLASMGQPQVLGNLNILNDSQNVNINLNFLSAQGQQGSASQALQQIQQNKLQMSGGQVVQTTQNQGSNPNPTTPIKILPKSHAGGTIQGVNLQPVQQQMVKPVVSSGGTVTAASSFQGAVGNTSQQMLPMAGQDILSAAVALNDIPLQMQASTTTSQSIQSKPVINTASSIPSTTVMPGAGLVTATSQAELQPIKVEQKPQVQTIKVEQKPVLQAIKTEPIKTLMTSPQQIRTSQGQITVIKQEQAPISQSVQTFTTLPQQQQVTFSTSQSSGVKTVGSASQGLQALAASSASTSPAQQGVTIHHQPAQVKATDSGNTGGLQQISIPAISQGSVMTTMTTIQTNGSNVPQQQSQSARVVRGQPAPNVNIANMQHLQTLPANADLLVKSSTGTTTAMSSAVASVSSVAGVTTSATTPTVIPAQVSQPTAPAADQTAPGQSQQQGLAVGNQTLLQRIQQQIRILLNMPNRTEQQQKMLQQLAAIQKKIMPQVGAQTGVDANKHAQTQQAASTAEQPKTIVIQPITKPAPSTATQPVLTTNQLTSGVPIATAPGINSRLVMATMQSTMPGTSTKLLVSNAVPVSSAINSTQSLQGLLSSANTASNGQKPLVNLASTNTVQVKGALGMQQLKQPGGLIQMRAVVPGQTVMAVPSSGVAVATVPQTGIVTSANPTSGGQVFIAAPSNQPQPKVTQIQLPPGLKEKLQQQLMKLPPDQQEMFKKNQAKVMLKLHQQLMAQQQRGTPVGGITKIPITVNATTLSDGTILQSTAGTSMQPVVVAGAGGTQQFIIKRQVVAPQPMTRGQLISQQLARDQKAATHPDCKTPFKHYKDACQKLLRYHVFQADPPNHKQMLLEGDDFEERAQDLVERKERMFNKFELLTYKEAMRERVTSESVMLEKLFLQEENKILEEEKRQAISDPVSFIPRPSKRPRPSPDLQEHDIKLELKTESDVVHVRAAKVPKYGPTPSLLSPGKRDPEAQVSVKQEATDEVVLVKEEPVADTRSDAYSAHSSGGLKMVFKSSPAHIPSADNIFSSSESLTQVAEVKQEEPEETELTGTPFQGYVDKDEDHFRTKHAAGVSEDDAAVAGLLSVASDSEDVQIITPDFNDNGMSGSETDGVVEQRSPYDDDDYGGDDDDDDDDDDDPEPGFSGSAIPESGDRQEVDSAVHGLMDDMKFSPEPSVDSGHFDDSLPQDDPRHDYLNQSAASETEMRLTQSEGHRNAAAMQVDSFGELNPLNTEMESAINSILSLNDSGDNNDFDGMDDFIGGGDTAEDSSTMFSMHNENADAAATDGQDDIEAAVQSILM